MHIPEYFCEKMTRVFGEEGSEWVADLPRILEICIKKWKLSEVSCVDDLSMNLVCLAISRDYGEVVLKLAGPHPERYTEMQALALYNGRFACQLYAVDKEVGALLLERITPGHDLTSVPDLHRQLQIGADLAAQLPVPVILESCPGMPTYEEWVQRAVTWARSAKHVGAKMLGLIHQAEELFEELKALERPQVLLHGDLHHWNILQDSAGNWRAIDPHGVIGIPCLESARFMNNHLTIVDVPSLHNLLDEMVRVFAEKLGESKRTIAICLYVLYILSTIWTYQEAEPDPEELVKLEGECEFVLNYIREP